ncbi:Stk1 family PASTA domain-containing Ser/Thr kinase [Sinomonas mesophila]|uniref:Stk1 family PASTA domain-containing Ser/Thr kinase n=1 Tax=Sinomonas mesophila TaxID=1531955 RepID=UPI000985A0F4|nr:Stk1 family PASTA domain-containing Ser/Thr kinase [Sinomonas mesophila]
MPRPLTLSGRYELGKLLGRGGMADVYEARDLRLGRTVAVKMLRPDMARDRQFRVRFEREARAVAGLSHPSIVAVYDTGEHSPDDSGPQSVEVPYIVMELVTGQTLRELVRGGALTVDESVEYVLGVLSALEYSHRQGIVHRDIKPANVMVCRDTREVKVMDFGIARATADSSATMTQTQAVVGTAQYLSPEQAQGEVVDSRSDLYSAGCLLYELLAGRPPFVGDSPVAVAYQHVQATPQPVSDFNPEVSDALQSVLDKALRKDPAERFQDAGAFRRALRAARAGVPVPAQAAIADAGADADDAGVPAAALGAAAAGAGVGAAVVAGDAAGVPTAATQAVPEAGPAGVPGPNGDATATGRHAALTHLGDTGEIPVAPPQAAGLIDFDDARDEDRARRGRGRRGAWIAVLLVMSLLLVGAGGLWLYNYMNQPAAVATVEVPGVEGMSETQAALTLQGVGLQPVLEHVNHATVPIGYAVRTIPAVGTQLDQGSRITLEISKGPSSQTIPESIVGATEAGARSTLQSLGLKVAARSVLANHPTAQFGTVISTNPGVGQTVAVGTEVVLTVSTGKVTVPELRGKTLEEAQKALADLGLKADVRQQENSVVAPGTVTAQSPGAEGSVDQGGTVVLTVAVAPAPSPTPSEASPSPKPSSTRSGSGND